MSSDVPAALPLIAFIAGLACGSSVRDALALFAIAVLLGVLRRVRLALIVFCAGLGILAGNSKPEPIPILEDRFTSVQAPIDRDWMRRGDVFVLRVQYAGRPLTVYARFSPRPIAMEKWIEVDGFLRPNDRHQLTIAVKSPRLLAYRGRLSHLDPAAWNRALANRLRPYAAKFPTEVAMVEALALGRGEMLADDIRDNYKRGGTYHLLVFSGLQIALAAGVIAFLLRSLPAPRASDWSLLIFAFLAPMFIGPTASVSRSSIGIGLYAISRIVKRPTTLENLWCVSALVRLTIAPSDLTDVAFQLTYAGAGALLFVGKSLGSRRWIAYAIGAECAVTPLTLFHFHQYALGGSLTTILLTPIIFAMLVVSALVCAIPCAALLHIIGFLHVLCTIVNGLAAAFAGWYAAPPAATLIIGFGGALFAIAFLRGRARAIAIVVATILPSVAAIVVGHGGIAKPTLTILDVGQGDAILIRTANHAVLVDAGSRYANVVPLLLDRGVRRLDAVFLTHVHPDHCGGLPDVIRHLRAQQMWISPRKFSGDCAQRVLDATASEGVPVHLVRNGERRRFGDIDIRMLLASRAFKHAAENNSSVVLRVTLVAKVFLLTGDIERESESDLVPAVEHADVLKVAHHGSRSSTTAVFLDAARPRIAVISCGRRNLFGHPHGAVIEALGRRSIRVYRTDRDGSVDLEVDRGQIFARHQIDTPQ
ncbi:MAG TPA: DNA internalization-related competence protein ComEC/Rec2 [Thermoanaerobaculia bacterium]|nr:DNA internalization-related competence protein ComEC/Rec2 [Thermoanaerobaculia bacterium]